MLYNLHIYVHVWHLLYALFIVLGNAASTSPTHHQYGVNTGANYIFPALDDFLKHSVIKPQIHHSKHKRAIHSTLDVVSGAKENVMKTSVFRYNQLLLIR